MKKLFILLAAVVLTAISANVFAQTGLTPQSGSTHSYWVNTTTLTDLSSGHSASHVGSIYTWEVLRAGGTAADNSDYQFSGNSSGENQFSVQIKWLSPAIADGDPYFLVVTEQDATGCKNMKVVQIDPQNAFAVVIQNVDETLAALDAGEEWCAPDITLNLADANIEYNYGITTLYFRVDAQGLDADWSFDYAFEQTGKDENSIITAFWGEDADASTPLDYEDGGEIEVIGGAKDIIIKVVINNGTIAEGETADHNIKLTLSEFSDGANAPVSINGESAIEADVDQTVKARPATSGIQTE